MEMRRPARRNSSSRNINGVKVLAMGPRTVSPSVDNARWRGTERGRTTFIIRVGNCMGKANALRSTHSCSSSTLRSLSIVVFCCMPFFPFFSLPFSNIFLIIALSLSLSPLSSITHLSLFLGIALYIKTCLEPHRIRTTHVPSTGLVSFLSSHYSSSFFLSASCALFWGFCLFSWWWEVLCLVLFLPRVALSCRVPIDRPFPSRSHRLFKLSIVYFTSFLLSHLSVTHPQANVGLVCRIPVPLLSLTIVYNVKAAIFLLQVPCKFSILYAQCSISEY